VKAPPALEVRLLGGFRVSVDDQPVPDAVWRQKRAAAVVKLLALEPAHRLHREQLADALWPELDPEAAANNLRVALHHARQGLRAAGAEADLFLLRDGDAVVLGPPERVRVDVEEFDAALKDAWRSPDPAATEAALAAWHGDLLPGDLYDDWAEGRRTALRASYLTLLRRLAGLHEERAEPERAIAALQRLLAAEPLDEDAHAALIRLFAQTGQTAAAVAQYDHLAALLARELGAEPQAATRELLAAIRAGRTPAPPAAAPAPPPTARPHGLPAPVDELIGRERELAELRRLLATTRLLTLTGPGGVGKTRLALAAAHAVAAAFPDGALFADLSPLDEPEQVLPALARAVGARETAGQPLRDALVDHLAPLRLLLAIDNMEHVASAAPLVADLLAACPGLTALITSRGRLKLHGEQEYPVEPLAVPDAPPPRHGPGTPALAAASPASAPAIALFVRRAQEARPDFALTGENAGDVFAICRRLDGLPLALELAAARVRLLPPAALLARLDQPLAVLTGGPRDAPARHHTLRATIAWSHDLLTPEEQDLFARLSVFAGGWTLEAAEWVAGGATLDLLASLVDQSLVRQTANGDGAARFGMLATIRAYARERLEFGGEMEAAERRHASYFLTLAETAAPHLDGPRQGAWLDRLDAEHDNLRAALTTLHELDETEDALRLAAALWRFWWQRGYLSEGRSWLEDALADAVDAPPAVRADAHDGAGALAEAHGDLPAAALHHEAALQLRRTLGDRRGEARALADFAIVADRMGDPARAAALLEDALAIARDVDDRPRIAACLANLGFAHLDRSDHPRAAAAFRESLELFRDLGDQRNLSYVLGGLGNLAFVAGDYAGAVALQEESLRVLRALGDRQGIAHAVADLGHAVQRQGDLDRAGELFHEALRRFGELGDRGGGAFALTHLGRLARLRGDPERAEALLREGLQLSWQIGERPMLTEAIEGLAEVACDRGDAVHCARLLGAAETLRETTGIPLPSVHQPAIAGCVATARAALGEGGFAAARGEGRALAPEQVVSGLLAIGEG
jgi:predicted ATPase/DNA-binding SARP family transcriptional activator